MASDPLSDTVRDTAELDRAILRAVAATARYITDWVSSDEDKDELRKVASAVERYDPDDDWCCPVCEEVRCDDGCPLAPIRNRQAP